jgi:hypothetical protein
MMPDRAKLLKESYERLSIFVQDKTSAEKKIPHPVPQVAPLLLHISA